MQANRDWKPQVEAVQTLQNALRLAVAACGVLLETGDASAANVLQPALFLTEEGLNLRLPTVDGPAIVNLMDEAAQGAYMTVPDSEKGEPRYRLNFAYVTYCNRTSENISYRDMVGTVTATRAMDELAYLLQKHDGEAKPVYAATVYAETEDGERVNFMRSLKGRTMLPAPDEKPEPLTDEDLTDPQTGEPV